MLHASYARRRTGCLEAPRLCYNMYHVYPLHGGYKCSTLFKNAFVRFISNGVSHHDKLQVSNCKQNESNNKHGKNNTDYAVLNEVKNSYTQIKQPNLPVIVDVHANINCHTVPYVGHQWSDYVWQNLWSVHCFDSQFALLRTMHHTDRLALSAALPRLWRGAGKASCRDSSWWCDAIITDDRQISRQD